MSDVRIITNNHIRDLVSYHDLPETAKPDFDYMLTSELIAEDDLWSPRFVQYKGSWYDVNESEANWGGAPSPPWMKGWDNYQSDSFFSGILFRYPTKWQTNGGSETETDWDAVIVGRYYS